MDLQSLVGSAALPYWLIPPAFLFVITVIIVVHELGHYIAARACGVNVAAFSLGFGPEVAAYTDKAGTRWRLALYPLGGYVKFIDDDNASSVPTSAEVVAEEQAKGDPEQRKGFYHLKPVWQRAIIAAAGPFANFLLAVAIFTVFTVAIGELQRPVLIDKVEPGMPAAKAGLLAGDTILSIDGTPLPNFERLSLIISTSADRVLPLVVKRGDQQLTINVTPELTDATDILGGKQKVGKIGIQQSASDEEPKIRSVGVAEALQLGFTKTKLLIQAVQRGMWDLVTGRQSLCAIAGPTKMAQAAGVVASYGPDKLINFLAFISIAIGMTNLLPIPILDGGHLAFYAIEAVRRKPLSQKTQEIAFRIGLAIVLMLLVVTIVNHLTGCVRPSFLG
jgi:regulator of sigma E protease